MDDGERVLRLTPGQGAARAARGFVVSVLSDWSWTGQARDTVVLACHELVTNALVHARSAIVVVRLRRGPDRRRVRVEVFDTDPRAPDGPHAALPTDTSGRGLAMVEALTDRWGVDVSATGKTIWAEASDAGPEE